MLPASAACPSSRARTLASKIRPPPAGTTRPNVLMRPRIWLERSLAMPMSWARPPTSVRTCIAAQLFTRTSRKNPASASNDRRRSLVRRRVERRLRMPCVDAHRWQACGRQLVVKPGRERPGLEHHKHRIRRVLADRFGHHPRMRQALAAPDPLAVLPHRDPGLFQGHVQADILIHGYTPQSALVTNQVYQTLKPQERSHSPRFLYGKATLRPASTAPRRLPAITPCAQLGPATTIRRKLLATERRKSTCPE